MSDGQAKKKPGKGKRESKWRILTPDEWLKAREEWEADERLSAAWIAEKYGVALKTVKDRITTEKWIRRIHKQLVHVPRPRPPWRPTMYRPEFVQMLLDFFARPAFQVAGNDPERGVSGAIVGAYIFPTLERFAATIGVTDTTLWNWATEKDRDGKPKHPDFLDAYKRAKNIQKAVLIEGGMAGVFNSPFAQLAARNLGGWRQDPEHEEQADENYPDKAALDRIYQKGMEQKRLMQEKVAARRAAAQAQPPAP
jgi:hypothetical protein